MLMLIRQLTAEAGILIRPIRCRPVGTCSRLFVIMYRPHMQLHTYVWKQYQTKTIYYGTLIGSHVRSIA